MTLTTIGRWGRQVAVQAAAPYPVEHARPSQESRSLYGGRWVRQAPGSRRAWVWDLAGLPDSDVADIEQLFHDSVRGPLFWADPTAHVNMVRHDVAEPVAGTLGSDDVVLTDAGEATVDGRAWDMVDGQLQVDVPTVDSTGYTVLLRSDDAASSVTVESLDDDRQVVATVASATGSGPLSDTWTASTEAGVRVTADGPAWSGLQVYETSLHDGSWRPGRGIPQVRLEGLTQQLLWALASGDVRWRDLSVRLVEVDS